MTADAARLLADLARQGVVLRDEGGKLAIRAPRGVLTAEIRERLALHKPALLELLARGHAAPAHPLAPAHPASLAPAPRDGPLSLSPGQQRLWFLDQLEPRSAAYNIAIALRLEGPLDEGALARGLAEIVRRHEALRTTFAVVAGQPAQVVAPPGALDLARVDLRGREDPAREARRVAAAEAERPFDLARGPLFRATLVWTGDDDHTLLLTVHHIVFDGLSTLILARELGALYAAFTAGAASPLPALPLQYADFARWQRDRLASGELDEALARARDRLAGAPPALRLPADRPRHAGEGRRGARIARPLPATLDERLHACAREEGVTPFVLILAAFSVLLGRLSGQSELLVGAPSAGRVRREVEALIGFFVNTLVVRVDLAENPTFRELLARVAEAWRRALAGEEVPFEQLVAALQPERRLGRAPLFQVMFNLVSFADEMEALPGLRATLDETMPGARFDLTLYAIRGRDRLRLELAYDADLFDEARTIALLAEIEALLDRAIARPDQRIGALSLVTPEAAPRLPDPAAPISLRSDGHVLERFAAQARSAPDRPAVIGRGEAWSYGELRARAAQLARLLADRGVRRGDVVAILGHRSGALVWAMLGVLDAGAAFAILDPRSPPARLAEHVAIASPRALVALEAAGAVPAEIAAVLPPIVTLPRGGARDAAGPWDAFPEASPGLAGGLDDLAYVAFTSGSTGRPRGVLGTHRPLAHFLEWHARTFDLGPGDRFAMISGLGHDPLLRDVFTPLAIGAAAVAPDRDGHDLLDGLAAWMQRAEITVAHLTPAHARLIAAEGPRLPALRYAFSGGDALAGRDVAALRAIAPNATIVNFYGATETPQAMSFHVATARDANRERVPIGRGIEGVDLLVLRDGRALAGVGELGEIHVRTPYLARGYAGDPAATSARFLASPFTRDPGDRVYRTGDLGRYLPDGSVEIAGRVDRQLKIRGVRVEPGEIEAVLAEHPAVRAAAVAPAGDDPAGARLAAWIVPAGRGPGLAPSPADLRAFLRARLPDALVPASFTLIEALPLTVNGKVDLRALPEPEPASADDGAAPLRTPAEEVLATLWAAVLGVEFVGAQTNFFDAGGHSLLAVRLVARIRDALGVDLPVRAVFEAPTVAALAERVERALGRGDAAARPIVRAPRDRELPASFAQQRLWFLDQLEPGDPSYRITQAARLGGPLDAGALDRALAEIERRHEILRTTFAPSREGAAQIVGPPRASVLAAIDLAALPEAERAQEIEARIAAEARAPFDLAAGPLWRATLLRISGDDHVLLVTMHHIVSDGWSMGVLRDELAALHGAIARGRTAPLPELAIQYADHAAHLRRALEEGRMDAGLAWWKERLAGVATLDLPGPRPRPAVGAPRGAARSLRLPAALVEALRALSRRSGATLFMTLLAAFDAILSRYTGQVDVAVGTPVGGRADSAAQGLIGLFVDVVVVRCDLSGDPSFRELVGRVRDSALGAHAHRDVPFERVVEALAPARDRARSPLFQVLFNMFEAGPERFDLGGVEASVLPRPEQPARFDLTLYAIARGVEVELSLVHDASRFEAAQAAQLLGHLREVLEAVVADPDRSLSRLPLSRPAAAPAPARAGPPGPRFAPFPEEALAGSIARRFAEQARRAPEAVAVLDVAGALTYGELDERALRVASALAERLGPGEARVGLLLDHDATMVTGILGALAAGKPYVPLDPSLPAARLAFMARDAGVSAILARGAGTLRAREIAPEGAVVLDSEAIPRAGAERLAEVSPLAIAYILYTSGSTGHPKGVVQSHRNVLHHVREYTNRVGIDASDRLTLLSTFAFDAAVMDVFGALLNGATLCPIDLARGGLAAAASAIAEREVTVLHATPTVYRALVGALREDQIFPRVRRVVLGGEEARRSDVEACRARFGADCVFVNGFGPTESTLALQCFLDRDAPLPRASVPLGHAVGGVEIALVEGGADQAAIHGTGEIVIRSPFVALGYWNRPDLTDAAFSEGPDPDGRGARSYRTGDRGRLLPDGSIEFAGRCDAQVKIRGYRVEPGEIEACLRGHPRVLEAAVVLIEDASGARLIAHVTERQTEPRASASGPEPRPSGSGPGHVVPGPLADARGSDSLADARGTVSAADRELSLELRAFLRSALPEWMVPSAIHVTDALPLTATGKIDRRALAAKPLSSSSAIARPHAPPRDAIEAEMAAIWGEILELDPAAISTQTGFFDLGGHSLLSLRLVDRVARRFGRSVPLAIIFDGATVADLAALVRAEPAPPACARLVAMREIGSKLPFFCVAPPGARAALLFDHLARRLDPVRPFFAVEAPPLGPGAPSVEAAARSSAGAIRAAFPQIPRLIGGFSNGGVIAFEVAAELARGGDHVLAVALLDAAAPAALRPGGREAMRAADRDEEAWRRRFAAHLARTSRRDEPSDPTAIPAGLDAAFEDFRAAARADAAIISAYAPARLALPISLFRAESRADADLDLGWSALTSAPIDVVPVPGDHHGILAEPHVGALAAALSACLDRASRGPPSMKLAPRTPPAR